MNTQEGVTPQSVEAHTLSEITEMFRTLIAIVATKADLERFATKEDVKKMIAESEYRLKDHVSKEITKTRDIDFHQNEKVNEFVQTAEKSGAITHTDSARLIAINPLA